MELTLTADQRIALARAVREADQDYLVGFFDVDRNADEVIEALGHRKVKLQVVESALWAKQMLHEVHEGYESAADLAAQLCPSGYKFDSYYSMYVRDRK